MNISWTFIICSWTTKWSCDMRTTNRVIGQYHVTLSAILDADFKQMNALLDWQPILLNCCGVRTLFVLRICHSESAKAIELRELQFEDEMKGNWQWNYYGKQICMDCSAFQGHTAKVALNIKGKGEDFHWLIIIIL